MRSGQCRVRDFVSDMMAGWPLLIVPYLRALIALPDVGDSQLAASCLGGVCFTQVGQRFVREGLNPNGACWARIGICRSRSRPEK